MNMKNNIIHKLTRIYIYIYIPIDYIIIYLQLKIGLILHILYILYSPIVEVKKKKKLKR